MPNDVDSRQKVADRMGNAFAQKASPALIRALTEPPVLTEAVDVEVFPTRLRADVVNPRVVLEVATASTTAALMDAAGLGRQRAIAAARAAFDRDSAAVLEFLQVPARDSDAPPLVETCWLASAMRARFQESRLAEVAHDDAVEVIDVTRAIWRQQAIAVGGAIRAPQFRSETGLTGKGVLVAVIDGEALRSTVAFQDRLDLKNNYSFEPWGRPDNHGTAVAAIVGARSPSIAGIAPEVLIHNYKVFPLDGYADDFDGALAIQKAVHDQVQIANCSWGRDTEFEGTSREARACDRAWVAGMVVVKSSGDGGPALNSLTTPADAAGVIVVGGTVLDGSRVANYSSRGNTGHGPRPHLVAPGGNYDQQMLGLRASGSIGAIGFGTSLAAPHVTGALALLLERTPGRKPDQLRADLLAMCTPIAGADPIAQGNGLLRLA